MDCVCLIIYTEKSNWQISTNFRKIFVDEFSNKPVAPMMEMATNDERKFGLPNVEGRTPYSLMNCVNAQLFC
jgi:hypothetical protein